MAEAHRVAPPYCDLKHSIPLGGVLQPPQYDAHVRNQRLRDPARGKHPVMQIDRYELCQSLPQTNAREPMNDIRVTLIGYRGAVTQRSLELTRPVIPSLHPRGEPDPRSQS